MPGPNFDNQLAAGLAPTQISPETMQAISPITMAHLMQSLQTYKQQGQENLWKNYLAPANAANDLASTQRNITPINQQRVTQFAGTQGSDAIDQTLQKAMDIINKNQQNIEVKAPTHSVSFEDVLNKNPNAKPEDVVREFQKYKAAVKGGRSPQSEPVVPANTQAPTINQAPAYPSVPSQNPPLAGFQNLNGETYAPPPQETQPITSLSSNRGLAQAEPPPNIPTGFPDQAPGSPQNLLYNASHLQPGSMMSPEEAKIIEGKMALEGQMAMKAAMFSGRSADQSTKSSEAASYATQKLQEVIDTSTDKLLVEQAKAALAALNSRYATDMRYLKDTGKKSGTKELNDSQIATMTEKADKAAETEADKKAGFMKNVPNYQDMPQYKANYQAALARQWQSMQNAKVKASFYAAHQDELDAYFANNPGKKALTNPAPPPAKDPVLQQKIDMLRQHDAFKKGQ